MKYWIDCRGTQITEGAKVAYNYSGDVVPGEVVGLTPGHVKIRLGRSAQYSGSGRHISKVKRPRSILVLEGPA